MRVEVRQVVPLALPGDFGGRRVGDDGGEGPVVSAGGERQGPPDRGGLLGFVPGLPQARGVIAAQFGQGPGQGADQGWAVYALDPESGSGAGVPGPSG